MTAGGGMGGELKINKSEREGGKFCHELPTTPKLSATPSSLWTVPCCYASKVRAPVEAPFEWLFRILSPRHPLPLPLTLPLPLSARTTARANSPTLYGEPLASRIPTLLSFDRQSRAGAGQYRCMTLRKVKSSGS